MGMTNISPILCISILLYCLASRGVGKGHLAFWIGSYLLYILLLLHFTVPFRGVQPLSQRNQMTWSWNDDLLFCFVDARRS